MILEIGDIIMMDNVIILAGGQGKRMKTDSPKVLCEVLGVPMILWVTSACEDAGLENICIVKGYASEVLDDYLGGRYEQLCSTKGLEQVTPLCRRLSF